MTRYYCDYCDTYLTHDSVRSIIVRHTLSNRDDFVLMVLFSVLLPLYIQCFAALVHPPQKNTNTFLHVQPVVRKQHNDGYKHKVNAASEANCCHFTL